MGAADNEGEIRHGRLLRLHRIGGLYSRRLHNSIRYVIPIASLASRSVHMSTNLILTTLSPLGAIYGEIGRHQDLGPHGEPILTPRLSIHGKVKYASQILELLSFGSAKLSVLFLYRRIFAYSAFTRVANVSILLVAAWTVSFFFTIVFQCSPVSVLWTMLEMDQRPFCVDTMPFFYANSISDVLLDVAILAMPVPLVWGLRLSVRKKLAVGGMFMLGAL